jgi:hypothetical protein
MKARFVLVATALTTVSPVDARGTVVFAGGAWAAIDRGNACEALARSVKIAPKGKVQPTAGFAFTPDHRRWGEFHAQLSRIPRPGSSVMLQVGNQPFLLVVRDGWAWSRGPLQEQAIITAMRYATGMRIEARDTAGNLAAYQTRDPVEFSPGTVAGRLRSTDR